MLHDNQTTFSDICCMLLLVVVDLVFNCSAGHTVVGCVLSL